MQLHNLQPIHAESSQFGSYRIVDMIYDGRSSRMLFGDGGSQQSGMALDDNPELIFDYNQRFLEIMMSQKPSSALVIGGGVMMLPKAACELFPGITIDVVEIDKILIKLARNYFELPNDPRLAIHVADGIDFVKSTSKRYDMIAVDAFYGYTVPSHLIDLEAAGHYKNVLNDGGLVAINIISEYKLDQPSLAHSMVDDFLKHFKHVELYQSDPYDTPGLEQNMLLVASDANLSHDYLQSLSLDLHKAPALTLSN